MKPATLKALKQSIAHWQRMKKKRTQKEQPYATHCALCRRFDGECDRPDGEYCPVAEAVCVQCWHTPYSEAKYAFYNGTDEQWREAAQKMIDFLKSLLPVVLLALVLAGCATEPTYHSHPPCVADWPEGTKPEGL